MENKIHMIWLQGEENAPIQIKNCINSARRVYGDDRVMVWTMDELLTAFPRLREYKDSGLKLAQFCDLARLEILYECGGTYFDADFFLIRYDDVVDATDKCYTYSEGMADKKSDHVSANNGFIHADKPHSDTIGRYLFHAYEKVPAMLNPRGSGLKGYDLWAAIGPRMLSSEVHDNPDEWVLKPMHDYQNSLGSCLNSIRHGGIMSNPKGSYGMHLFHNAWAVRSSNGEIRLRRDVTQIKVDGKILQIDEPIN